MIKQFLFLGLFLLVGCTSNNNFKYDELDLEFTRLDAVREFKKSIEQEMLCLKMQEDNPSIEWRDYVNGTRVRRFSFLFWNGVGCEYYLDKVSFNSSWKLPYNDYVIGWNNIDFEGAYRSYQELCGKKGVVC